MLRLTRRALGLATLCMLGLAGAASGQEFPSKPITLVVPFGAGSGADTTARILAESMGAKLGQPIVVENKPGASGMIGSELVKRAEPDGYTLLFVSNSTHGTNPSLVKNLSYDPIKDFSPIGGAVRYVFLLTANSQLGLKSADELVKYAKENPGKLSYASGSPTSRIMAEVFKKDTGTDITYVAYKATPQGLTDVVGGRVSMMFIDLTSSKGFLKSGEIIALGVTSATRSSILPDVPTLGEQIKAEFALEAWTGFVAPANTPEPIVAALNTALNDSLNDPAIKERLAELGSDIIPASPQEFGEFIKAEVTRLGGFVHDAGLKPQ